LLVAGTTASAAAFADDHDRLRGTYAFTGTSSCLQTSASIGFNSKFTPNGPPGFYNTTDEGVRVFRADGTGTVNSRSVSVSAPPFAGASSGEYSLQFTSTIGPDGKLSITMVPGTFKGFVPDRPARRADGRARDSSRNRIHQRGRGQSCWARTRRSSRHLSTGEQFVQVCNRSRTPNRISDDDR
jgi:hypothetical protein